MYSAEETKELRCNVALELARHKMLIQMGEGTKSPSLDDKDINEIMVVAGLPLLTPSELDAPEVQVIKCDREDK